MNSFFLGLGLGLLAVTAPLAIGGQKLYIFPVTVGVCLVVSALYVKGGKKDGQRTDKSDSKNSS